ncbi:hypothetical protein KQI74_27955 [Paenibacillus barcinonensis]|uniref:hypothetical protein n=1 Tax=Paenibacillus barcinonensis TaxID=198119 RepID=UPI001C11132F|nr:hypothetical protein [Paenibacillus barcinonensis]MBU5356090.1 hypothetical protein [Paenibacillus barcinonensis]
MKKSVVLLLSFLLLTGCSGNVQKDLSNSSESTTAVQVAPPQQKDITKETDSSNSLSRLTAGDFKKKFNTIAKKHNLEQLVITELNSNINDDTTITFKHTFNENINMIMKTDKNLKLSEVFIVSNGDVATDSGKVAISVLAFSIMTANPGYEIEDVNTLLTKLGWLADGNDPMQFTGSLDQNGILYKIKSQDNIVTFDMKPSPEHSSPQSANDFNGILTIDEFKDNFKKVIDDNSLSIFNIDDLEIKDEPTGGGTFNLMLKETIALTGTFNQDRKIEIASLLVTGDGTETTGEDIIITMGMFIIATNPSYSISNAEEVLTDLGMDQSNMEKIKNGSSIIRNGVRYSMNFVKDTNVVMLSARSANDQ